MEFPRQVRVGGFTSAKSVASKGDGGESGVRREILSIPRLTRENSAAHVKKGPSALREPQFSSDCICQDGPYSGEVIR